MRVTQVGWDGATQGYVANRFKKMFFLISKAGTASSAQGEKNYEREWILQCKEIDDQISSKVTFTVTTTFSPTWNTRNLHY
jgi:hypothetical protein